MEHYYYAENESVMIRPLQSQDIEKLRGWRNDKHLSTYLADIPYITKEMQKAWYQQYLTDKDTMFFAVIDKNSNTVVGSVALYAFSNQKCEVGKIVVGDPSARGKGIGYGALILAMAVAFTRLNMETIVLSVHENNYPAKAIYEKAGFRSVGTHEFEKGGNEIEMQITKTIFIKNGTMKGMIIQDNLID